MAKRGAKPPAGDGRTFERVSPGGRVVAGLRLAERLTVDGRTLRDVPLAHVSVDGLPLLAPSPLAAAVAGEPPLEAGFAVQRVTRPRAAGGVASLSVTLRERDGLQRLITWNIQCGGDRVSFRFTLPRQPGLPRLFSVQGDRSRWMLPSGAAAAGDAVTGSAVIRYPHGRIALASGWGRFEPDGERLDLAGGGAHAVRAPFVSPPRSLRFGRRPCDLLTPPPGAGTDAVVRDATFSTAGGLACVRLAAALHARYVLYGSGWCGDPGDSATTGLADTPDPRLTRRFAGWAGLDVAAVARAGAPHGIGVLLTLPWETVARRGPELFDTYARRGVAGVVTGRFAARDDATAARLAAAAAAAAARGLLLVIADAAWYALPLGGAAGLCVIEADPPGSPAEACGQLFSRGGLGVARACPGAAALRGAATHPHRLALPFVAGGRLPLLFDGCAPGDRPGADTPECALWRLLPRGGWDETRWLRGEPGEYAVVARRTGERWFVAGINGGAARVQTVRLEDALPAGGSWRLTLYRDACAGDDAPGGETVAESFDGIRSDDRVRLEMAAGGGYVLALTPAARGHG